MNGSPEKNGNTYRIGEELLKGHEHEVLQMADYKIYQYDQVYEDDQMKEVFQKIKDADVLVIGSPVYWYHVSGILKTFIDRLYMFSEASSLSGKKLYLFAQGSDPSEDTKKAIRFLATRMCYLMGMELKGVSIGTSDGAEILNEITITD